MANAKVSRPEMDKDDKPAVEKDKVPLDQRVKSRTVLPDGTIIEQY